MTSEADQARAAALADQAREREAQLKWREAHDLYKESLALHHDEAVEASYLRVRAAIHPA